MTIHPRHFKTSALLSTTPLFEAPGPFSPHDPSSFDFPEFTRHDSRPREELLAEARLGGLREALRLKRVCRSPFDGSGGGTPRGRSPLAPIEQERRPPATALGLEEMR